MPYKDYFIKGTRKYRTKTLLLLISGVLIVYLGLLYFLNRPYYADYPCSIIIEDGYIVPEKSRIQTEGVEQFKDSAVYITTKGAHLISGGGCLHKSLSNGESMEIKKYTLRIDGDKLLINGDSVTIGGEWNKKWLSFDFWDPWYIHNDYIKLKNEGFVRGIGGKNSEWYCEGMPLCKEFNKEVLFITGVMGTDIKFNIITSILFFLSLGIFIILEISSLIFSKK